MIDGPHLAQLMRLSRLLCSPDGASLNQLKLKLKASRRTVFRELKLLQRMSIPVQLVDRHYHIKLALRECRRRLAASQIAAINKLLDSCMR